jgi:PhnB protein
MGADMTPDKYEKPKGFTLSLHVDTTAEAERVFDLLAKDGIVLMPLGKTFWAARFGTLVDRFGMPWVINGGGPESES